MVLSLRTPTFRNFTFAELREDVVIMSGLSFSTTNCLKKHPAWRRSWTRMREKWNDDGVRV